MLPAHIRYQYLLKFLYSKVHKSKCILYNGENYTACAMVRVNGYFVLFWYEYRIFRYNFS